ncbi:protein MIZU-KUSSEI 1-like [Lycium ferocissimum]|uniref:protein MIZU-KUSSEI 1-like n=1 Tax=Lycium ferocissimum TaxID=112874 RepID=UPI0028169EF9|nr:protein MIZU-KUSSEI 1-like [Lycium ferocissimum]
MISSYPRTTGTVAITTVDCQKQVRSWRLLRSLMELLIPTCKCTFVENDEENYNINPSNYNYHRRQPSSSSLSSCSVMTGTIFGYRRGKVSFCIQTNPKSATPALLLELAVSTSTLAREMHGGSVRIALESGSNGGVQSPLRMYCNGKKVGFAVKRKPTKADLQVLRQIESVNVGAGIIHGKDIKRDDDIMYLRGKFERVHGSYDDSESFHLIDPEGSMGQELSIFFLPSRS